MPGPPSSSLPSLTLIVATTPSMGIGRAGSLPWPSLRSEMAYFARVTKRPPSPPPTSSPKDNSRRSSSSTINAVVMGRKTWESIPGRYRPLRDRINVVISRRDRSTAVPDSAGVKEEDEGILVAKSLEEGVVELTKRYPCVDEVEHQAGVDRKALGRVFVIGGEGIYRAALGLEGGSSPMLERILWTRIRMEFECDVFFPLDLEKFVEDDGGTTGWVKRSTADLERWTGLEDLGGMKVEEGVEYEFCMLEKVPRK